MNPVAIFGLQFILSLIVWGLIAKWFLVPWLDSQVPHKALFWLTLPHAFRHMGMVFLVPGIVSKTLPDSFSAPAAYGDLITGLLALLTLMALRKGWAGAIGMVWLFNIFGSVDLLNALRHADVAPQLGAAWYIPTIFVPLLLVTHFMIFSVLLRSKAER